MARRAEIIETGRPGQDRQASKRTTGSFRAATPLPAPEGAQMQAASTRSGPDGTSPRGGPPAAPPMRRLPEPLPVVTARHQQAFELVASGPAEGVLVATAGTPLPPSHTRLVLKAADGSLPTVQLVAHVLGTAEGFGAPAVQLRWLTVTATERRAYLVKALREVLGMKASVCVRDDLLGPHRKLVYNPQSEQVRLVTVGEEALPRPGRRAPTPPFGQPAMPEARSAEPKPGSRKRQGTMPFIVLERSDTDEHARQLLQTGEFRAATPPPTRRERPPMPIVRRPRDAGSFTADGQIRSMWCGWVGHTHLTFRTHQPGELKAGDIVGVGVPASPIVRGVVWVEGRVSEITPDPSTGQSLVEVDLRAGGKAIPERYERLVDFWTERGNG